MTLFNFLWPYLHPYRWYMAAVLVCVALATVAGLLSPWLVRSLVQTLAAPTPGAIAGIAAGLLVATVVRSLCNYGNFYLSHVAAWRLCHDLRMAVYRHMQRFSPAFYAQRQSGELVARVLRDTDAVEPLVADMFAHFAVSALMMIGAVVILLQLDAPLTLAALIPLPLIILLTWRLRKPITQSFDAEMEHGGKLTALVQDHLSGMKEIQLFNRERHEQATMGHLSRRRAEQEIHSRKLVALLEPLVETGIGLSTVFVVWFGSQRVLSGVLGVEDLVAFVLYLVVFYQPIYQLIGVNEDLQKGLAGLRRVRELLSLQPEVADPPQGVDPGRVRGAIHFAAVSFSYRSDLPVLHDLSFTVQPGQTVALVGPTGAGKSTIVSLVARFYDPTTGAVLIDGVDLRTLRLDALRRNISMVLQDVFLFNGTVRENIRFGKPEATDDEVSEAARIANAHEFVLGLPQGYDTEIGERGVRLSGGQKQRLSIARAVLKDAPILILDEATSAVDTETEAQIQEALTRLMRGRTCLVIAHRLSTVRGADAIAVIDSGRLVEWGRHDAIVEQAGLYQRLHERQAGVAAAQILAAVE
jgi:ABC-type multidrug transport system fused ATPase/permease subunit